MIKLTKLLVLFLIPLLLCSCWDYTDINKKAVVLSLGVDYNSTTNKYSYFGEAANFSLSSGEQQGAERKVNIFNFSAQGSTLESTKLHSDSSLPVPVFLGATSVVVFGKSIATKGIEPYLHRIDAAVDYSKTLTAVISKEPPEDLLKLRTDKAVSVGSLIQNNLQYLKSTHKTFYTPFGDVVSSISLSDVGYVLPYVGIQANDVRYLGLAVMKDSKLVGIIDMPDTKGLIYLLSDNPLLIETIPGTENTNNTLSFHSKVKKRKIKAEYIDNTPVININLEVNFDLNYQYRVEPISEDEIKQLEDSLSKIIQKYIQTIVTRSQKEFQCDIFNFVKYFRADCPKAYKSIDWKEAYTTAKVNVKVSGKIVNLGLDDPNAKIKTSEGKQDEE